MNDLPVKKSDGFLAEVEVMDLSKLRDGVFIVAVGTGDPNGYALLPSTIHGPYKFVEMLQEVGDMWMSHQHHAKVMMLEKSIDAGSQMLDANTIDYIECHYTDIITEEMLGGAFDDKDFTCQAGTLEDDGKDPRRNKTQEVQELDEELDP